MRAQDDNNGFWSFMETVAEIAAALLIGFLAGPERVGRRVVFSGSDAEDQVRFEYKNDTITLYNDSTTDACCSSFTKTSDEGDATVEFVVVPPSSHTEVTGQFRTFEEGLCQIVTYPSSSSEVPPTLPTSFRFLIQGFALGGTVLLGQGAMSLLAQIDRIHVQNNTPYNFNMSIAAGFLNFSAQSGGNARANGATDFLMPRGAAPSTPPSNGRVNLDVQVSKI